MSLFGTLREALRGRQGDSAADRQRALALVDEGNALEENGRSREALSRYDEALRIAPTLPRAHLNRGNALLERGDTAGAIAAFSTALSHDPGYFGAHFNLGNAYFRTGRADAALASYLRAAEIDPGFVDVHVAMGCAFEDLGRPHDAIASYDKALALQPGYGPVHSNRGNALRSVGRFDDATQSHRRAVELDPASPLAHNNLGNALKDVGMLADAEASYRHALAINPDYIEALSNLLFCHNYRTELPPAQLTDEARAFGIVAARQARSYNSWHVEAAPSKCLRVGLVSGDFRDHPVGYFLESVMSAMAAGHADRLHWVAYATAACNDSVADRIKASCSAWHEVQGMSDEALAERIHGDRIDVLIDLSGHSAHNRLPMFAWRPSPVQMTWLGYFATTGIEAIDYLLADPWTLPEGQEEYFTEKIWRLPETRLCFTAPDPLPPVANAPMLANGHVTFGCFNNVAKVNDAVMSAWSRVLDAVPGSTLLLKSPQLGDPAVRARFVARLIGHGVAADRLLLEGLSARQDYLAAYGRVDIALDPFPYTGGTTTAEALWMGVPVLTLAGQSFLSRQGVGLLENLGLHDWVGPDVEHYVKMAAGHAANQGGLAELRSGLRSRMLASPIMDAPRFARHFDAALREIWRRWCAAHSSTT